MTSQTEPKLVQATAVAIGGRGVLIEGPPGAGKSSLALALIDRGATLIGDDGARLTREDARILISPPPNITGKLEVRHVGIVELPVTSAPLSMIVTLAGEAPRLVVAPPKRDVMGQNIPHLILPAHDNTLAIRTEWALKMHGLSATN